MAQNFQYIGQRLLKETLLKQELEKALSLKLSNLKTKSYVKNFIA
ncbi:hypothetical protein RCZ04_12540 [Capnocytophaga sp. HP1101]